MTTPATITVEIQKLEPSAIVEFFELDGTAFGGELMRFHAGTNQLSQNVVWQGNSYTPFPLQASGFDYSGNGQLPRPKMVVSNVTGAITLLVLTYDDLLGAKVTRKRTLVKYLDAVNFPGGTNPTADPAAEFGDEIFYIDRKVTETRDLVEFELAAAFDVAGVRLPRRQIIQNVCTWKYRSGECGWTTPEDRRNLLTQTEVLTDSVWLKTRSVVESSSVLVPATLGQAFLLRNDGVINSTAYVSQNCTWPGTDFFCGSIFAKAGAISSLQIDFIDSGGFTTGAKVVANLLTGVITTATAFSSIAAYPNGWYRISMAGAPLAGAGSLRISLPTDATAGTSGLYICAPQIEAGTSPTDYQAIGASYTDPTYFNADDATVANAGLDVCGKRLSSCKVRFGANEPLPFGSFPAAGLTR